VAYRNLRTTQSHLWHRIYKTLDVQKALAVLNDRLKTTEECRVNRCDVMVSTGVDIVTHCHGITNVISVNILRDTIWMCRSPNNQQGQAPPAARPSYVVALHGTFHHIVRNTHNELNNQQINARKRYMCWNQLFDNDIRWNQISDDMWWNQLSDDMWWNQISEFIWWN